MRFLEWNDYEGKMVVFDENVEKNKFGLDADIEESECTLIL